VGDLVDFVRVKSARVDLDLETVALEEEVDEAVQLVTPMVQTREQELLVQMGPLGATQPQVGRRRLVQVLLNLLNNASRYSPAKEPIIISAQRRERQILVSVTDRCGGIPPEDQEWLFQAYFRPRRESPASAPSGSGLGLAIARGLVELHGGKIWLQSTPGQGCTFSFSLPLGAGSVGAAPVPAGE
jgi:signal transduction histidine kinase